MRRNDIYFKMRKYSYGWSVWIKADSYSILLGSKLKKNEAEDIIRSLSKPKINYSVKEYNK